MCISLLLSGHFIAACLFLFTPLLPSPSLLCEEEFQAVCPHNCHPLAYERSQVETRSEKSEAQSRIPNFIYPHVCTCDFVAHIFLRTVILLVSFYALASRLFPHQIYDNLILLFLNIVSVFSFSCLTVFCSQYNILNHKYCEFFNNCSKVLPAQ